MRVIKFRPWHKVAKSMGPPQTLNQLLTAARDGKYPLDGSIELFMWTGLKDKNGKEIFEGDIVRSLGERPFTSNFRVFWDQEHCGWHLQNTNPASTSGHLTGKYADTFEVIGNIKENPELLGKL